MPSSWDTPAVSGTPATLYIETITIDLTGTVTDLSLRTLLQNIRLITAFTVKQLDSPCDFKAGSASASANHMTDVGEWRPALAFFDLFITKLGSTGSLVLEVHGR